MRSEGRDELNDDDDMRRSQLCGHRDFEIAYAAFIEVLNVAISCLFVPRHREN